MSLLTNLSPDSKDLTPVCTSVGIDTRSDLTVWLQNDAQLYGMGKCLQLIRDTRIETRCSLEDAVDMVQTRIDDATVEMTGVFNEIHFSLMTKHENE